MYPPIYPSLGRWEDTIRIDEVKIVNVEDEENDDKEEKEDKEVDTHEEFVAEGEDDIVEDSFDDDEAPESVDDIIEGLFGKSGEEEE